MLRLLMSCIGRNFRRGLIGRMGRQIGLTLRCGRIGLMVFFCLERGTSDIRVLRLGLGGVVVSIWRFGRSGSLSSDAPKFVECFNGLVAHRHQQGSKLYPHLSAVCFDKL